MTESPGKYLKAERESQRLSLKEVAGATKIREPILKNIEEDRYEDMAPLYVKGFLSGYARYLGLDPNNVILMRQKNTETLTPSKTPASKQRSDSPKKKINVRLLVISIPAVLLAVLFAYSSLKFLHRVLPSPEKKESKSVPSASLPSSLPVQKEAETQPPVRSEKDETRRTDAGTKETKDTAPQESVRLEVEEAGLGTGIERKNGFLTLKGKSTEFVCNNQKAYFLTRIKAEKKGNIVHVWLWQGQELHKKETEINPPGLSVSSFITLKPLQAGDWIAEARYEDKVIAAVSFKAVETVSHSTHRKR